MRQGRLDAVAALAGEQVPAVECRGLDPDQQIAAADFGLRDVAVGQDLRTAGFGDVDCFHVLDPLGIRNPGKLYPFAIVSDGSSL